MPSTTFTTRRSARHILAPSPSRCTGRWPKRLRRRTRIAPGGSWPKSSTSSKQRCARKWKPAMRDTEGQDLGTLLSALVGGTGGSVTPPIVQTSLFAFDSYQAFVDRMAGASDQPVYTRVQNPTVAAFEGLMASAERGAAAVGFASGMAAISSTVLALVRPGDRIACVEHVYPDAYRLFERLLRPFGVEITYHPGEAFEHDPD